MINEKSEAEKKLKPCPFCGSDNIELTHKGNEWTKKRSVQIKCKSCIATRTTGAIRYSLDWCEEKAIELWNERKEAEQQTEELWKKYHMARARICNRESIIKSFEAENKKLMEAIEWMRNDRYGGCKLPLPIEKLLKEKK